MAEPEPDEKSTKGKGQDKLASNTPDVGAAFVGYFSILGDIVREMNRLELPTRYEPVRKCDHNNSIL